MYRYRKPLPRRPRILLVGAYERDNVGDLLFLLVTERFLSGADVVAAAPFAADMTELLGRHVPAYGPLLRRSRFDAVWTVGGEVGGTSLAGAYRMSASPGDYSDFRRASGRARAKLLRSATGRAAAPISPYMPSPGAYRRNAGTPSVLNSVGLAGIAKVEPNRRSALIGLVRGTTRVTVRDVESSTYLSSLGIDHALVPDAVHTIASLRTPGPRDENTAVIQLSGKIVGTYGHRQLADAISASPELRTRRIHFIAAGTATGHDAFDDYYRIIDALRRSAPEVDARVIHDRRPLDIVGHIQRAGVVVGSSLHVRIIACAYAVPRVSLRRAKTTRYARWWDDGLPFDVAPADLPAAVRRALDSGGTAHDVRHSFELARRAADNLGDLAGAITGTGTGRGGDDSSGNEVPDPLWPATR